MSTEYKISSDVSLVESSCKVVFFIGDNLYSKELDAKELRKAIIKQIEVLSYISDKDIEVLKRFNVEYGQTK